MLTLKRLLPALSIAALLLTAAPSALAKGPSAAEKRSARTLAHYVNQAHVAWRAAYPAAQADMEATSKTVADSCLPAMAAAGKLGDSNYSGYLEVSGELAAGYAAALNSPSDDRFAPIRKGLILKARKISPNLDDSRLGEDIYAGMVAYDSWSYVLRATYITPAALCADAETWQADSFSFDKEPRSLMSAVAGLYYALDYPSHNHFGWGRSKTPILTMIAQLRRYGLTKASANAMRNNGFSSRIINIMDDRNDPVMKALTAGPLLDTPK
jgi:hypothetical protein